MTAHHRPPKRPRIGLALGAGVARGWAHIGVVRALADAGIVPDIVCGTSIGALIGGASLIGGLNAVEDWSRSLTKVGFYRHLDFRLAGGGLFGGAKFRQLMLESFGEVMIENLPRRYAAVATDLATGHETWLQKGLLVDAIRASFALPGFFHAVELDGRWLVDGALVNPVPVSACRALGAEIVIAVNLNADIYGRTRFGSRLAKEEAGVYEALQAAGLNGEPKREKTSMLRQVFGKPRKRGEPSLFSAMASSLTIMQDRISRSRLAGDPPDVMIAPRAGHIGILDFHRAEEAIQTGYEAFERSKPFLIEALVALGFRRGLAGEDSDDAGQSAPPGHAKA